jgi:hypothetical protein
MDFDFPEPYDVEVPRRIGEAREELSLAGVEVLERILAAEGSPLDVGLGLVTLPVSDRRVLMSVLELLIVAGKASASEHQGWADLHRHMVRLHERARELDLSLGDDATTGEAVAVLRRHGEPLGISDEVLEMAVEMPEE